MKTKSFQRLFGNLYNKNEPYPVNGLLELTYRCNLSCVHCYCRGLGYQAPGIRHRELTTEKWKKILNEIKNQGCIWLTLSGGEPLIRDDFLELYSFAKTKGLVISLFTNGLGFRDEILNYLAKFPPYSIEITLNGITPSIYESITQVRGSFSIVMENIKKIKEKNLPLILKANCLKQNRKEVGKIKQFVDRFLGKRYGKYYFRFDPMIYPRLNRDMAPCNYRLSFKELQEVQKQDIDIWQEYQERLHSGIVDLERDRSFLYRCDSWRKEFFINPYGRLKFCEFTDDFSVDLTKVSFRQGFYHSFPRLSGEKFRTNSKCRDCNLRTICPWCPAKAYLETGDKESPVRYYCHLAKEFSKAAQGLS